MVQMNLSSTKSYIKLVLLSLILIFIGHFIINSVSADTIYVDDGGGGDFTSIQEAIDAANESDTINVFSGEYVENIVVNKTIHIVGAGSSNTEIIGSNINMNTIEITADNVQVSGFSIDNNAGQVKQYHCIFLDSVNYCDINNNVISNGEYGIWLLSSSNNVIQENTIQDNNQKGIRLSLSNNNDVTNNMVHSNGDGIYLTGSDSNEIWQNIIFDNGVGISLSAGSDNNYVYENDFDDNTAENAADTGSNYWYNNGEGNYWDDYNEYDMNNDGIGDTPYIIDSDSQDIFPLGDFLGYNQKPIAHIDLISPNSATVGQTISFHGHGTDDGMIVSWQWTSSKDGVLGASADVTASSLSVGTHTISFRVQDDDGQWSNYATDTLVITDPSSEVNQPPEATIVTIDPISSTEGESIYFHGYGVDTDGTVTGYSWMSSKDGIISSSPTFTSSDLSAGAHTIYFKVKDNDGDWSTEASRQISIMENQTAVATPIAVIECPVAGVINHSLRFDASKSYVPDDPDAVLSFSWDFGDGKFGTGEIITHSFQSSGNYTVTLRVQDSLHHSSSKTASLSITNVSTDPDPIDNSTDQNDDIEVTPGFGFAVILCGICVYLFINIRRRM